MGGAAEVASGDLGAAGGGYRSGLEEPVLGKRVVSLASVVGLWRGERTTDLEDSANPSWLDSADLWRLDSANPSWLDSIIPAPLLCHCATVPACALPRENGSASGDAPLLRLGGCPRVRAPALVMARRRGLGIA